MGELPLFEGLFGIYIHKIVTINKQFYFFSTVYFKKNLSKGKSLSLVYK